MWLYLALLSYFLNAIVYILDKYLLASPIPKPYSYAFAVASLSIVSVVLIPFGVTIQSLSFLAVALLSGASFFIGLILLYLTISKSDISIAATSTGTFGAIFTFIFSLLILDSKFSGAAIIAFIFLILGILLTGRLAVHSLWLPLFTGVCFGLSYVLLKWTFNEAGLVNGIFWTRAGFVLSAFLTLISASNRSEVFKSYNKAPVSSRFIFVLNKVIAAAASLIVYLAIRLSPEVSFVNALLGFQFLFTFILALLLKDKIPGVKEHLNNEFMSGKIAGIACVVIGFMILFIYE